MPERAKTSEIPASGNPSATGQSAPSRRRRHRFRAQSTAPFKPIRWTGYLLLCLVTLLAFYPIFRSDVLWSEYESVRRSPFPTMSNWTEAWTLESMRQHDPLSLTSYFIESALPLPTPLAHHALNVLLHLLAAVLLLKVTEALRLPGALFAALVFALHPMVVPAVFWSGYRDLLLAAVLALAALLYGIRNRHKWDFLLMLLFSGLGFLCHQGTLALPFVLALAIYFQKPNSSLPDYNRVLPVACLALMVAVWLQPGSGPAQLAAEDRLLAEGSHNLAFFIEQGLLPREPALFHPFSDRENYSAGANSEVLPFAFFLPFYIVFGFNFRKLWARGMLLAVTAFYLFALSGIFQPGSFIDGQPAKEPANAYLALPFIVALLVCGTAAFFSLGGPSGLRVWRIACGLLVAAQLLAAHSFTRNLAEPSTLWRKMADQWPSTWQPRLAYLDSIRTSDGFQISDDAVIDLILSILERQPDLHDLKYELLALYLQKNQSTNALNEYRRILRDTEPSPEFLREAADYFDRMNLSGEAASARSRIGRLQLAPGANNPSTPER